MSHFGSVRRILKPHSGTAEAGNILNRNTAKTVITAWISDQLPKRNPHMVQVYFLSLLKWMQTAQTAKSFGTEPKTSWKSKPAMSYLRGLQSPPNDSSNWNSGKKNMLVEKLRGSQFSVTPRDLHSDDTLNMAAYVALIQASTTLFINVQDPMKAVTKSSLGVGRSRVQVCTLLIICSFSFI